MNILRRFRPAAVAAATAGLLVLAACGGGGGSTAASGGNSTLKVSFFPDNPTFACIDPFQVYWIEGRSIIRNFADSLTDQDPQTGKIVPWLAKSWDVSADGKTYTFHLRDGVTFSNGKKVDAQAVADDATGWIATVKATNGAAYGASYIQGLTGATVVDPSTVAFHLAKPSSSFLQATSTTNLAITDPSEFTESPQQRCTGQGIIASGLFKLDHYTAKVETVLTKRAGYAWPSGLVTNQGEAKLDKVVFNYVAEDSVRTGNLISGAIDIDWPRNPFSPQDEQLIKKSGDTVEARSLPGPANNFYANTAPGRILSDPQVRKAVYAAFDVKTYAATIFGADYPVVQGPFDTTTPYFKSEAGKLVYNPDSAAQILQADGWIPGPDGIRVKNGQKLTLDYPITTQFSAGQELLQAQVKKAGIDLKLRTLTPAEQATYIPQGAYDLTTNYFTRADPGALQFILNPDVANSKALARNAAAADQIKQIQALFAKATQSTDVQQTTQAYAELQDYLIDQDIAYPLYERVQKAGVSSHVHGFAFTSESFLRLNDVSKS